MTDVKKLGRAVASQQYIQYPANVPGYVDSNENSSKKFDYRKDVKDSRYYYRVDPIAGTVMNRVCDIAVTQLRNRRKGKNNKQPIKDDVLAYYNFVAIGLNEFLKQMALEYLLHGMVVPEFTTVRKMGTRATEYLGRTRYEFPDKLWCRNVDNIELKRLPSGSERLVYLKIPADDIELVKSKGKKDKQKYDYLVKNYPEYVQAISTGETKFLLDSAKPIYRKLVSFHDYPIPYLSNALDPIKHKARLKAMDMSITSRVIEAIRQIKMGNNENPYDDDDIKAEEQSFNVYASTGEKVFNYFTNHTIEIVWSYPPFEALLSDAKYSEPNLEIFFALGFPRIWVNGETEKSNSSDNALAAIGPLSTINDVRDALIRWIKTFYEKLADLNGFDRIPEPYFSTVNMSDVANLIQYAKDFTEIGAISKDTVAAFYGSDYETEMEQRLVEEEKEKEFTPEPDPTLQPANTGVMPDASNNDIQQNPNEQSGLQPTNG